METAYYLDVVESVWKSKFLLSVYFFFITAFIKADFPTFVYPTRATTGILEAFF